jgi:ComF family protein
VNQIQTGPTWREWIAGAGLELARLLLPNSCVVCERMVESQTPDALVCAVCRTRFAWIRAGCDRCGQPVPPVGPCRFCAEWPAELAQARSAIWLSDEARKVVHHLKYDDYPGLAALVAQLMRQSMCMPEGGALIPIPLSARKLRLRGYNQASLIARELGRAWGIPVREDVLFRSRDTTTQTALTPGARLANVAAAFSAARRTAGAGAILVDDVLTTGATLRAAAQALVAAGWDHVTAVTFARALPFDVRALADR